jgi:hypothetical protein
MIGSRWIATASTLLLAIGAGACSVEASEDPSDVGEALVDAATPREQEPPAVFTNTYSIQFEYSNQLFLACDSNLPGEFVQLQGTFEGHVHETIDGRGSYHIGIQFRPTYVAGVGQISGTLYRLRGAAHNQLEGESAAEFSFMNEFRLIGPGAANDGVLHIPSHYRVSESGVLDPSVFGGTFECR